MIHLLEPLRYAGRLTSYSQRSRTRRLDHRSDDGLVPRQQHPDGVHYRLGAKENVLSPP
ncbi:hypothetical protein EES37_34435 [Streptomyces sp. ADI91-18]|nr:hypothetical protein EES37_34435 [Streptomyces sp. ADI91-18]